PTCRIADFQSADAAKLRCHSVRLRLADWKSAIQQIGDLRYSRARLTHYGLSLIRLYFDEDAGQHGLVAALRLRGVDLTRAQDENLIGASDERQLRWCVQDGRVFYSFNVRHFYALHADWMNAGREH